MRTIIILLISLLGISAKAQTLTYTCSSGVLNTPWTCAPVTTGLVPPLHFSIGPGLPMPSWMTLDPDTGVLSGTPPYSFDLGPSAPTNLKAIISRLNAIEREKRKHKRI